jgi:6-phosphogluconate dehydrogenase
VTLAELARIWRGGCIIRARLLDQICAAFQRDPQLSTLLLDDAIAAQVCKRDALRSEYLQKDAHASDVPGPPMFSRSTPQTCRHPYPKRS